MSTIIAEFVGGPRCGEVRALPALLPEVVSTSISVVAVLKGEDVEKAATVTTYDLEYDAETGDPVKREDRYRYIYRRPE